MKASDRARQPGISAHRVIQMLAGAVVADVAMNALAVDTLEISPWALREGILLQRLDSMNPADRRHANQLVSAAHQDLAGCTDVPR